MRKGAKPWKEKWETEARLGGGGQGDTFRVKSRDTSESGVAKLLKNSASPQARRRMHKEVEWAKLLHAAGCKVPQVLEDNVSSLEDLQGTHQLYFISEFIEGENLEEFITSRGGLSKDESLGLVSALTGIVKCAYAEEILHRDIKPTNIIVCSTGKSEVVLVDWGVSFNIENPSNITEHGESIKNEFLRLPERTLPGGDLRDIRSDITCLVGVLFYCITAEAPRELRDEDSKPPHRREAGALKEKVGAGETIQDLEAFFDRGFQISREDRYQSLDEFEKRLDDLREGKRDKIGRSPADIAASVRKNLLRRNPAAQLEKCEQWANVIRQWIQEAMGGVINSVNIEQGRHHPDYTFHITEDRLAFSDKYADKLLGKDIRLKTVGGKVIQIMWRRDSNFSRAIAYLIGCKGRECIILRASFPCPEYKKIHERTEFTWKRVSSFDGVSGEATRKTILKDLNESIAEEMEAIAEETGNA